MSSTHRVYRALLLLYPKSFRKRYGDDLVQHLTDLIDERGARAAWVLTSLDLLVTLPAYRLETVMNERRSAATTNAAITLLALAGVAGYLTGQYPGALFLLAAVALGVVQRSTLARAIRIVDGRRRRRRFVTAAALAGVFAACYVAYLALIGESWTVRETVLVAVGTPAFAGAVVFFVVALLTPKSPRRVSTPDPVPPTPTA